MEFTVSREDTLAVIGNFLEMGHVENIVAMFCHDAAYYEMLGELVADERLNVRLGVMILLEELAVKDAHNIHLALPSLAQVLQNKEPLYRGEALNAMAITGKAEAKAIIQPFLTDANPQVKEAAELALEDLA